MHKTQYILTTNDGSDKEEALEEAVSRGVIDYYSPEETFTKKSKIISILKAIRADQIETLKQDAERFYEYYRKQFNMGADMPVTVQDIVNKYIAGDFRRGNTLPLFILSSMLKQMNGEFIFDSGFFDASIWSSVCNDETIKKVREAEEGEYTLTSYDTHY